jgi:hypothetical protein
MKKTFNIKKLFQDSVVDYRQNWKLFIFIGIIFFAAEMFGNAGLSFDPYLGVINQPPVISVVGFLLKVFLSLGFIKFLLNMIDGKEFKVEDVLRGPKNIQHFIYFAVVSFVYAALIGFGTVLFVIPGIFLSFVFLFSQYLIEEEKTDIFGSFTESWNMTKGNRWKILGLMILLVLFNIAGLLAFVVGLAITIPVTYIIYTRLYRILVLEDSSDDSVDEEIEIIEVIDGDQTETETE